VPRTLIIVDLSEKLKLSNQEHTRRLQTLERLCKEDYKQYDLNMQIYVSYSACIQSINI